MNVLIVDDHPIFHETLGAIVSAVIPDASIHLEKDFAGAKRCARGPAVLDLALLDLGLPDSRGIATLQNFRKLFPHVRVTVVSAEEDRACMRQAIEAGAVGFIPKTSTPAVTQAALRLILAGGVYVPREAIEGTTAPASGELAGKGAEGLSAIGLSESQGRVLRLLIRGKTNLSIAQRLGIAESTVKKHVHAAFIALGVSSRAEAMVEVARRGLELF